MMHVYTHKFVSISGDWFGRLTWGLSEIPLPILWCRQTLETKPVSSTWQVRGHVSSCFMVSIHGSKPDIELFGEWEKWRVWLTRCLVKTCRAALSAVWKCWHNIFCTLAQIKLQVCVTLQCTHFKFSIIWLSFIVTLSSRSTDHCLASDTQIRSNTKKRKQLPHISNKSPLYWN